MKFIKIMLLLGLSWVATAQNLITNGDFDSDIGGWFAFSTISWVSDQGAPLSGDGCMLNTGTINNNGSFPAISDQFMVQGGYWYLTGAAYNVPAASPVPRAYLYVFWYDDMGVLIDQVEADSTVFGVPNDVWGFMDGLSQAPDAAVTGEIRVYFQTAEPGNPDVPYGLWDDVYVLEETVFISGFE